MKQRTEHYVEKKVIDGETVTNKSKASIIEALISSLSETNDELNKELVLKEDKINELCDEIFDLKAQLSSAKAYLPWYRKLWLKVPRLSVKWEKRV